jgi:hypothetical protein
MITPEQEDAILSKAYVPEHIVSLMSLISRGEPCLVEDFLCFAKDNWLIFVGYPLGSDSSIEHSKNVLSQVLPVHRPEYLWFIGPEVPPSLSNACSERQRDQYYTLDVGKETKPSLERTAEKARTELRVERTHSFSKEHEALVREFLRREELPPRLRELYLAMPHYVHHSRGSLVLSARDKSGKLSAFNVVDLSAKKFTTYLLGCHSKKNYAGHASDLLFYEMIRLTRESGKKTIQLGIGVNEGIRRFKEKWGGVPSLDYQFHECHYGCTRPVSLIRALEAKL